MRKLPEKSHGEPRRCGVLKITLCSLCSLWLKILWRSSRSRAGLRKLPEKLTRGRGGAENVREVLKISLRSLRSLRLKNRKERASDQRERILANARQRGLGAVPRRRPTGAGIGKRAAAQIGSPAIGG